MGEIVALRPEIYVQPGESHTVTGAVILRTILGSCVGITFWAPEHNCAALCHPMLPVCPVKADMSISAGSRYVDYAIRDLARWFRARGIRENEVRVKLFGGADVLMAGRGSGRPTVGKLNSEAALRVLSDEGFEIAASSLGGNFGLNIRFDTGSGEIQLKRLN
ncbi:MAG TPA: chemotaxis protein CheD [Terracidiphilus sp.]